MKTKFKKILSSFLIFATAINPVLAAETYSHYYSLNGLKVTTSTNNNGGSSGGGTGTGGVSVSSITPDKLSLNGGMITINGNNFDNSVVVKIDGVAAQSSTINKNKITAIAPSRSKGVVPVTISSGGNVSNLQIGTITYLDDLVISNSFSPNWAYANSNTPINIEGSGFSSDISAFFINEEGIQSSASLTIKSETAATISAPKNLGKYRLSLSDNYGRVASTSSYISVVPLPNNVTVSDYTPKKYPITGGEMTITGSGFDQSSRALINGVEATLKGYSSSSMQIIVPPATAGSTATISIDNGNPEHGAYSVSVGQISYLQNLSASTISPSQVTANKSSTFTLTGSGFTENSVITILQSDGSSVSASEITLNNDASITFTATLTKTGNARAIIKDAYNREATSSGVISVQSEIIPITISTVSASYLKSTGGTTVVVEGSGFKEGTTVSVGGASALNVTIQNSGVLSFVAPSGISGPTTININNGTSTKTYNITYLDDISIANVYKHSTPGNEPSLSVNIYKDEPTEIALLGSSLVSGIGLSAWLVDSNGNSYYAGELSFGRFDTTSGHFDSVAKLTVSIPQVGLAAIVLRDSYGRSYGSGGILNVVKQPVNVAISNISPSIINSSGGEIVTVTGTGFTPDATILISGNGNYIPATYISEGTLQFTAPLHSSGVASITINNQTGGSVASKSIIFSNALEINGSTPNAIENTSSGTVSITGNGFLATEGGIFTLIPAYGSAISIPSSNVSILSDGSLTIKIPSNNGYGLAALSISDTYGRSVTSGGILLLQKLPQFADFSDIEKTIGDADFSIAGITSDSSGSYSYSSSNPSVVTISNTGLISIKQAGISTITISQNASGFYSAGTKTARVSVSGISPTYNAWSIPDATLSNPTFIVPAPVSNSNGAYKYVSSDPSIAQVEDDTSVCQGASCSVTYGNKITVKKTGTVTITATQDANGIYKVGSTSTTLRVFAGSPTIGTFTVGTYESDAGTINLTAPSSNSAGSWTFTSSDPSIATVSGSQLTINGVGSAIITATQSASGNFASGSTTAPITITKPNALVIKDGAGLAISPPASLSTTTGIPNSYQLRIYNTKSTPVVVDSVTISDTSNASVDQSCVKTLAANSYCSTSITYSPSASESKNIILTVSGSAISSQSLQVNLTATSAAKSYVNGLAFNKLNGSPVTAVSLPSGSMAGDLMIISYTGNAGNKLSGGGVTWATAGRWSYGYISGVAYKILTSADISANSVTVTNDNAGNLVEQIFSVMTFRGYTTVDSVSALSESLKNYASPSISGVTGGYAITMYTDRSPTIPVNTSSGFSLLTGSSKLGTYLGTASFGSAITSSGLIGIKTATGGTATNGVGYAMTIH